MAILLGTYIGSEIQRGKDKKKAAAQQEDMSRQAQEVADIIQQSLAQLVPGSQEYADLEAFGQEMVQRSAEGAFSVPQLGGATLDQQQAAQQYGRQLVSQQQQRIASGGSATPLEARTQTQIEGLRSAAAPTSYEQDILDVLGGGTIDTPGGGILQSMLTSAQNPDQLDPASYQTTDRFPLLMKQLEDEVGQFAARRGIVGSGLELEQLGRSGIDLGLAEAERSDTMNEYMNNLNLQINAQNQSQKQQALNNYMNMSNVGGELRNRSIGLESDLVNLQLGRESKLTNLMANQSATSTANTNSLLSTNRSRAQELSDYQTDLAQSQKNQLIQGLGTAAGAAGGFAIGGPAGAATGAKIGSSLTGGNTSVPSLLAAQSTNQNNTVAPVNRLSLASSQGASGNMSDADIEQLLRRIMQ